MPAGPAYSCSRYSRSKVVSHSNRDYGEFRVYWLWIKSPFCGGTLPHLRYISLCRRLFLHTIVANAWNTYTPQKNLVAKVLVASKEILLQAHVAEWPSKPATNPNLLDSQPHRRYREWKRTWVLLCAGRQDLRPSLATCEV